jgi:hypothetical protein
MFSWLRIVGRQPGSGAAIAVCTLCTKHNSKTEWDENAV